MQPIRDRFWLSEKVQERIFDLHDKKEMIDYCNAANSIGALFSFWSSIVLSRKEWNVMGYNYEFDGTAYALASSLISFRRRKCRLKYIKDPLVLWRNDNESFQNEGGLVKRFLIDFNGYLKLAAVYLSDDLEVKNSFLKIMTREHPWYTIIHVTSFIETLESWKQFKDKMLSFGYGSRMATVCRFLGRFNNLVSLGVTIKRKIVKSRWLHKLKRLFCRKLTPY